MQSRSSGKAAGCISAVDQERLIALIERSFNNEQSLDPAASAVLRRLRTAGVIVGPNLIPPDLVTMNSTVSLVDEVSGKPWEIMLVYPEDHDPAEACWSVLTPVGAAVFGLSVGDVAEMKNVDGSVTRWRIAGIPFQPEARGFLAM